MIKYYYALVYDKLFFGETRREVEIAVEDFVLDFLEGPVQRYTIQGPVPQW